ncbi:MAG: DNA/RNA nuclease SfsA [Ruminiclostridium sp.]
MIYKNTVKAKFLNRPNRFIANVELDGRTETVHVKNTGRCKELLIPGRSVILEVSDNPVRKTKYDLIAVEKGSLGWINIDSMAPNKVALEWLMGQGPDLIKPEFTYGKSRFDFYMEKGGKRYLTEIKGCTLEIDGIGYFPDAPTERGVKHLNELSRAAENGFICSVGFVIQMNGIREVRPNINTHKEFGEALINAEKNGVEVVFYLCEVTENSLRITEEIRTSKENI